MSSSLPARLSVMTGREGLMEQIMNEGIITSIQHFSIHGGPGIRTTVFFKGCPLKCWWCHNPENINPQPEIMYKKNVSEVVGKRVTIDDALSELLNDRIFYDGSGGGVTFSGGEPTIQYTFLKELASGCKNNGIHTALDTCGLFDSKKISELNSLIDLYIYDLKLINKKKHALYTGENNEIIISNLLKIAGDGNEIILRLPLIGGINDTKDDIADFEAFFKKLSVYGTEKIRAEILPYHKLGESKYAALKREYLIKDGSVSEETIKALHKRISNTGFYTSINSW